METYKLDNLNKVVSLNLPYVRIIIDIWNITNVLWFVFEKTTVNVKSIENI